MAQNRETLNAVFTPAPNPPDRGAQRRTRDGLNVSERYVRGGNLASVRRSEFGEVFVLPVLHGHFAFADLGRVVLPPPRGSAGPWISAA